MHVRGDFMASELFLSNWGDILGESRKDVYIDYDALLQSDDEFLCLESLIIDAETFLDEY